MHLPWYPPAPASGPASLLKLPPDDWALEPKLDGIRVIVLGGRIFTRQGTLLHSSKGAAALAKIVAGIPWTLDGEWVMSTGEFHLFDLPDADGDYDERRLQLCDLVYREQRPSLVFTTSCKRNFKAQ